MDHAVKTKARSLRKAGFSYSEILKKVTVSKSTLSLWLKDIELSPKQKDVLKERILSSATKGWKARKQQRIERTLKIKEAAYLDIGNVVKRELWLMGIMLYWAEGAKQKNTGVSQGICFSNSDKQMLRLFLLWLQVCINITKDEIDFDIYIHENFREKEEVKLYWSTITGFPIAKFDKIYYKKHKTKTNRKNIGANYHGLLRIKVKKSTDLNRKIDGWIEGICQECGIV